jgi:antitoxin (DNA-binding transcriptional repressor) of toxin-antitoxin stability system
MRAVGIRMLKSRLGEYVRLAAGGEVILVTDRERVVAELRPPWPERARSPGDALLAEAVRRGWVSPPRLAVSDTGERAPVAKLCDILEELRRDRDSR